MNLNANPGSQLLRMQVYEHLRLELKSERLKPGNFVRINQLSEELGISRTPLRDALLQLQAEGFVTFLPQRGILINTLSPQDIEDIYEVMGALDSRGLLSVFDRIGADEISRMKSINEEMVRRVESQAFHAYFELNSEFHNVYLNFSENHLLLNQLSILRHRLFDFGTKGDWVEKVQVLNYQEHLQLIALIESGDARGAVDFIRDVHCSTNW